MMHESTQRYIEITESDDAVNAAAIASLRATATQLTALAQRAAEKGDALLAVDCDEDEPLVRCLLAEAHSNQKTVARLVGEWQERTLKIIRHLGEVAKHDARLVAAATPKPDAEAPVAQ